MEILHKSKATVLEIAINDTKVIQAWHILADDFYYADLIHQECSVSAILTKAQYEELIAIEGKDFDAKWNELLEMAKNDPSNYQPLIIGQGVKNG